MNKPLEARTEDTVGCIAMQVSISAQDRLQRASVVELIGYLLAYAEQTGTRMRALRDLAAIDDYRLVFCFESPGSRFDFLHLIQLNQAIARDGEGFLYLSPEEINAARPIAHALPMDLVPKILAFADTLLGRCNRTSGL